MLRLQLQKKQMHMTVALLCLLLLITSPLFSQTVQAGWQGIMAVFARRHYLQWEALETEYFHVRYSEDNGKIAAWIGEKADGAVHDVAALLPHDTNAKRPWLVVVPDQETFQQVFGWGEGTGALGVYLADTIKILSPAAWTWVEPRQRFADFAAEGPLVHEYTHYVLDLRTGGNYTRWFSEGLSQLVEYEVLGYEWLEAGSSLSNPLYTIDELDKGFDKLPRQALAYRQSLSMVTYMEHLQGMDGLNRFIDQLGQGTPFYQALHQGYGQSQEEFLLGWQNWYREDTRWFHVRENKAF